MTLDCPNCKRHALAHHTDGGDEWVLCAECGYYDAARTEAA